jgi:hypothetical protein
MWRYSHSSPSSSYTPPEVDPPWLRALNNKGNLWQCGWVTLHNVTQDRNFVTKGLSRNSAGEDSSAATAATASRAGSAGVVSEGATDMELELE